MTARSRYIAEEDAFARTLGTRLVEVTEDRVVVTMPYRQGLGVGRVHGGAISGLVDIAATAVFWSLPTLGEAARGATVGFDIHFLNLAVAVDLTATATVRRRGGSLCTGEVVVADPDGREIAVATVTYKLNPGRGRPPANEVRPGG
ncbi:MAG: PaaI family thioesterase [Pseudomonadales bacterium]